MADQLPALHESRLPWHPAFEAYGIEPTHWQALVEAVFPGAQSLDSIRLALSYCKRRNLDPFKHVIHIVPVWDTNQRKYVDTIWPGIAELRTTAFRTQQYAGADPTDYGPMVEGVWQQEGRDGNTTSVKVTYPAWAQMTVYRLVAGERVPVPGPKVFWMETYSAHGRTDVPNARWRRAPNQMLEKCAEAAALRKAFPEELGDEHSHEEAGAITRNVTPPASANESLTTGNEALRARLGVKAPQSGQTSWAADVATEAMAEAMEGQSQDQATPEAEEPHPATGPPDPSRVRDRVPPRSPPEREPTEAEIARSQDMLAAVLGPDELAQLDLEVVKATRPRGGRYIDWQRYAEDYIETGRRTPRELLGQWRGLNSSMFEALRQNNKEEWSRASQALAEYERTGKYEAVDDPDNDRDAG